MKFWLISLLLINFYSFAKDTPAPKRLVIIGDSLTEGFGVTRDQAYPALLQKHLEKAGKNWRVINTGISGSTAASAPSRVKWHLKDKPDLLLIALGANDGLRGSSVKTMEENLDKAIKLATEAKVKVILAGIKVPPNYGQKYSREFESVFPRVAKRNQVDLIPFLLEKVGGDQKLNLADGIHPNEKGHAIIAETVFKAIGSKL